MEVFVFVMFFRDAWPDSWGECLNQGRDVAF